MIQILQTDPFQNPPPEEILATAIAVNLASIRIRSEKSPWEANGER